MTGAGADLAALFARSAGRFTERVAAVGADQWSAPTPCSDWSVRDLVNHVANEQLWAPHLVGGQTIADVGSRYDGDVLGSDPVATWRAAVAASIAAFQAADLDAPVHLSYADVPCREYLTQMLTDAEVHGWDLARAIGTDPSLLPEVVAVVLPAMEADQELLQASGMFAAAVDVGADASDADRLLGLLGRQP